MKISDILASIGVIVLLTAFLLNLYGKLPARSNIYKLLNLVGAGICCFSSWLISFYPFVVLEAAWAFVALLSLFNVPRGTSSGTCQCETQVGDAKYRVSTKILHRDAKFCVSTKCSTWNVRHRRKISVEKNV